MGLVLGFFVHLLALRPLLPGMTSQRYSGESVARRTCEEFKDKRSCGLVNICYNFLVQTFQDCVLDNKNGH